MIEGWPAVSRQPSLSEAIADANPWYVDDQFAHQFTAPADRERIVRRWDAFADLIARWNQHGRRGRVTALDAGCGDGINLVGLAEVLQKVTAEHTLIGADYNPVRTRRAAGVSEAPVVGASILGLPFADESFDIVLSNHVLEHVAQDVQGFAELHRVLRPGGLLIIGVPNEGCLLARLRNHVLQRDILATTDHVNFYTARSLTRRATAAGLTPVALHREGFFFPHQRVQAAVRRYRWTRPMERAAARLAPWQSAGLIAGFLKPTG